jgi:hypothetical protein
MKRIKYKTFPQYKQTWPIICGQRFVFAVVENNFKWYIRDNKTWEFILRGTAVSNQMAKRKVRWALEELGVVFEDEARNKVKL